MRIYTNMRVKPNSHRWVRSSISPWGCAAPRPRSGRWAPPCPPPCWTWVGSSSGCHPCWPSPEIYRDKTPVRRTSWTRLQSQNNLLEVHFQMKIRVLYLVNNLKQTNLDWKRNSPLSPSCPSRSAPPRTPLPAPPWQSRPRSPASQRGPTPASWWPSRPGPEGHSTRCGPHTGTGPRPPW